MTPRDVLTHRLINQLLHASNFTHGDQVVKWFGAIQSQDFKGAKWAIGQRIKNGTAESINRLFDEGKILRTHVMRPTWHFVAADDIRWLLKLTGERVRRALATNFRKYEIGESLYRQVSRTLQKSLRDGNYLTRAELKGVFERGKIDSKDPIRMAHLLISAEVDGVICSGPLRNGQFTYALLDERATGNHQGDRDELIAELTARYFQSHGPATVKDFCWWSGLTGVDAKRGLEINAGEFEKTTIASNNYYFRTNEIDGRWQTVNLLPMFDEYLVAYRSRKDLLDLQSKESSWLGPAILVNGQLAGGWKQRIIKGNVSVELELFKRLNRQQTTLLEAIVNAYQRFREADPKANNQV